MYPVDGAACAYELDADLRLVSVDEAWTAFALANAAPELVPPGPLGRPVLDAISDPMTRRLYHDLLARLGASGRSVTFAIRCDSPALRRFLDLSITPLAAGFRFRSTLRRVEPNPGGAVLEAGIPRGGGLLRICSWCKRVDVRGAWEELDVAVPASGLLETGRLPPVTHGICDECLARMDAVVTCA